MPIRTDWIEFAFWSAGANWVMWRSDFEFGGDPAQLPVLRDPMRFRSFAADYKLFNRMELPRRDALRQRLCMSDDWRNAVDATDGSGIDDLAVLLKNEIPGLGQLHRSFLSKLATFARPATFIPWDRFARCGVAMLTGGRADGHHTSYEAYLSKVNAVLGGEVGREIYRYVEGKRIPTADREAFVRRVLDNYLMVQGGRWSIALTVQLVAA